MSLFRPIGRIALAAVLFGGAAHAGNPPAGGATRATTAAKTPIAAAAVAATFDCRVDPAAPPASQDIFQATRFEIAHKTGTLPKGKKIAVRLGIHPTAPVTTTFCSDGFGRTKKQEAKSVVIAPPITDSSYIWQCNARLTSEACDPPPAVPR